MYFIIIYLYVCSYLCFYLIYACMCAYRGQKRLSESQNLQSGWQWVPQYQKSKSMLWVLVATETSLYHDHQKILCNLNLNLELVSQVWWAGWILMWEDLHATQLPGLSYCAPRLPYSIYNAPCIQHFIDTTMCREEFGRSQNRNIVIPFLL